MLPARQFSLAAIACLSIACTSVPFLSPAARAKEEAPSEGCSADKAGIAVLAAPMASWRGVPLRVIVAGEEPLDGKLELIAPNGKVAAKSADRHGGPPYFWLAEVSSPQAGKWQARLSRDGAGDGCGTVTSDIVVQRKPLAGPRGGRGVWPLRAAWNRDTENLYSAWIETLFDAPLDDAPSWKAMHDVLRE